MDTYHDTQLFMEAVDKKRKKEKKKLSSNSVVISFASFHYVLIDASVGCFLFCDSLDISSSITL